MQYAIIRFLLLSFIACFLSNGVTRAQYRPVPCPPVLTKTANLSRGAKHEAALDAVQKENPLSLYSIGEPSAEETYVLECINRARANPPAEGLRLDTTTDPDISAAYTYWGTPTRAEVDSAFQTYPSRPPFAFNANLIASGHGHDSEMIRVDSQYHIGPDGTPQSRATAAGYPGDAGESAFAYATSPWDMHASFQIDFGNPQLGHRDGNMDFNGLYTYNEIGICIVHGVGNGTPPNGFPDVGPLVTCQEFGIQYVGSSNKTFICGVVYNDANGNGFYDIGEGISGATITATGGTYSAVTSSSGAYTIPYSGSGSVTVTASSPALGGTMTQTIDFEGENVKVDFTPTSPQEATLISPSAQAVVNTDTVTCSWSALSGAILYHLQVATDLAMKKIIVNDSLLTASSKLVKGLKDTSTYYWRVAAKNAAGWAPYTGIQTFTTLLPPATVLLDSPKNGSTVPFADVQFQWFSANPRVMGYWFELASNAQMTSPIISDSLDLIDITDTTFTVPAAGLQPAHTYYWRVFAENDGGWSSPSAVRNFQTAASSVAIAEDRGFGNTSVLPNPTSAFTHIRFTLPRSENVSLSIVTALGQPILSSDLGTLAAGSYGIPWDASDSPDGSYFYQLHLGEQLQTGRILVLK